MTANEVDNASTTKTKATRGSVYTIHKCTLTNISDIFQINIQQACVIDKYENACKQAVAIEFTKRLSYESSTLGTFCRLKVCAYKKARQSGLC